MPDRQQAGWGRFRQLTTWILIAIVLTVAQPFMWNLVRGSAEKLQETRTSEEQSVALRARLGEITSRLGGSDQLIDQLSLSFLDAGAAPQAVERLEQLAGRVGLALDIIAIENKDIEELRKQEEIIPLSLHVQAVGRPSQLISYIDLVEHAPEVVDIRSWTLAPAPRARTAISEQLYAIDLVVYFYLLREI
ncbi:MAG: hypothetical protein WEC84_01625 [Candidatus Andersenbacteria bacterium]